MEGFLGGGASEPLLSSGCGDEPREQGHGDGLAARLREEPHQWQAQLDDECS